MVERGKTIFSRRRIANECSIANYVNKSCRTTLPPNVRTRTFTRYTIRATIKEKHKFNLYAMHTHTNTCTKKEQLKKAAQTCDMQKKISRLTIQKTHLRK